MPSRPVSRSAGGPFNLREILIEQRNTGFLINEVKLSYFWHDLARRTHRLGLPFAGRARYPADPDLLAVPVGAIAAHERWAAAYSRAAFEDWFIGRRRPVSPITPST